MAISYYSFWLVPQEPDLTYFRDTINALAKRFGTVPFSPHVTLYSGAVPSSINIGTLLASDLPAVEPLELHVVNLRHESRFSKTFYVQLVPSPLLIQLVDSLVAAIPNAQPPILDPHVSLLYHNLDPDTKQTLVDTITLPRSTIRFDQVQAIAAPQNFETQAHVSSLRCVHRQWLNVS